MELGQRVSRRGRCTYVETDRQRTYPDGRTVVDTFEATYRPAEGLDCNGNPVIPPPPPEPPPTPDPDPGEEEPDPGEEEPDPGEEEPDPGGDEGA